MMHAFHDYWDFGHAEAFQVASLRCAMACCARKNIFNRLYGTTSLLSHRFARLKQNAKVVP
jgi:hypothetical protein